MLCGQLWLATLAIAATVDVRVNGIEGELRDNVEAHLAIRTESRRERAKDEPSLSASDIRRLHRSATAEISAALQPFGYYAPRIEATLTPPDAGEERDTWVARYRVDPGPATRWREVDIQLAGEGGQQRELTRLVAAAAIEPGEVLDHTAYARLKSELQSRAFALGFLDAGFRRSVIRVYPEQQSADVALLFDTGPQFYFGDITIEQDILSPDFIDRFVEISAGEVFEPRRLTDLQLALSDTAYFSTAEVDIERERAIGNQVPVTVRTTPQRSQRYDASLGYGTDTGVRGGLGVLWRRINQHGHQFRTDIRLSQVQQIIAAQYKIPVGDVRSEFLDFNADTYQRSINDVDATSYAVGTSLHQNRWGGRRRLSLRWQHESWNFGDQPQESSTLLIPGIEYDRIAADDMLFTRRGYSFKVALSGAAEGALSDASFLQGLVSARRVAPLGERGRVLLRGEYGMTETNKFDALPPSQRFFAGGAQSVRGYGFEELSPRDEQGNLIGGSHLGVASVEVDYLFYGDFGLAAFVDTGNAADSASIDWKTGAGIGLRYKTPVGMVRVDFAHPFDDPDSSFAFHISFGPDLQ